MKLTMTQLRHIIKEEVTAFKHQVPELTQDEADRAQARASRLEDGYNVSVTSTIHDDTLASLDDELLIQRGMRELGLDADIAKWEAAASDLAAEVVACKDRLYRQQVKTNKVMLSVMKRFTSKAARTWR